MGLFSRQESPTAGRLVLRIELDEPRGVTFTLDEGEGARVWVSGLMSSQPVAAVNSADDAVRELTKLGLAHVRKTVPSLEQPNLQVRIDPTPPSGPELVCSGPILYLKSEWANYKAKLR